MDVIAVGVCIVWAIVFTFSGVMYLLPKKKINEGE